MIIIRTMGVHDLDMVTTRPMTGAVWVTLIAGRVVSPGMVSERGWRARRRPVWPWVSCRREGQQAVGRDRPGDVARAVGPVVVGHDALDRDAVAGKPGQHPGTGAVLTPNRPGFQVNIADQCLDRPTRCRGWGCVGETLGAPQMLCWISGRGRPGIATPRCGGIGAFGGLGCGDRQPAQIAVPAASVLERSGLCGRSPIGFVPQLKHARVSKSCFRPPHNSSLVKF